MHDDDARDDLEAGLADRVRDRIVQISDFDRWVSANNIPDTFEYANGWWDDVLQNRSVLAGGGCGTDPLGRSSGLLSDNWISPPTTITSPHSEA